MDGNEQEENVRHLQMRRVSPGVSEPKRIPDAVSGFNGVYATTLSHLTTCLIKIAVPKAEKRVMEIERGAKESDSLKKAISTTWRRRATEIIIFIFVNTFFSMTQRSFQN